MLVEIGFSVKGGFVASGCSVVDVGLGGCVVIHPRLWRLCGSCWVKFLVGGCTGSDCGRMSGQKSLNGRRFCVM